MRIDSHQHFWELTRFPYPWMPADPSPLRRDYLPSDLQPILARNNFDGCVAVQATTHPGEADWLLSLADQHPWILGVVAWVDLESPKLGAELDKLSRHPKFKGVRHPVHDESDHRWLLRPAVMKGLGELARRDIPYDLLLRPQHLTVANELIASIPELKVVIDHISKPEIASKQWEPWASDIARTAEFPHVHVKLSGMITEADWKTWNSDQLRPYVEHVLRYFGPKRCMFGSDWPVCLLAGGWKEVLAVLTQAHGPLDQDTRSEIFGGTAARFYRINAAVGNGPR